MGDSSTPPMFTALPDEIKANVFGRLESLHLFTLSHTHRSLQAEAERALYQSPIVTAQSTVAPPFSTAFAPHPRIEENTWPTDEDRWNFRNEQHRASTGDTGIINPSSFNLPADASIVPQTHQDNILYAEVKARQLNCQSLLHGLTKLNARARYIRHVTFDCQWGAPLFLNTQVFDIMGMLPHVSEVTVVVKDRLTGVPFRDVQQKAVDQLWDMLKDSNVTKITLITPNLKAMSKLMQLPTLDTFVTNTNIHWHERPSVGPSFYDEWLEPVILDNILHLDLGKFGIFPKTVQKLLLHAQNLRSLAITTRDMFNNQNTHIVDVLKESRQTLRELTIREPPAIDLARIYIPASNANFSVFVHLTKLCVTSSLWFKDSTLLSDAKPTGFAHIREDRMSARIHNLLPPSLQELEIQFNWPQGIFAKGAAHHAMFPKMSPAVQLKGCEWFQDLLEHQNRLPNLKRLRLVEVLDPYWQAAPGIQAYKIEAASVTAEYEVPDAVKMAFVNKGVELDVQLLQL